MELSHMIPGVNIISGKLSISSVNGARISGGVLSPQRSFKGQSPQIKFLGSKWHLHWLKIDLNAAE